MRWGILAGMTVVFDVLTIVACDTIDRDAPTRYYVAPDANEDVNVGSCAFDATATPSDDASSAKDVSPDRIIEGAIDPATLPLTGFFRGAYAGAPWIGTTTAGASGNRTLVAGVAPAVGVALNTLTPASFNGTTQYLISSVNTAEAYLSPNAYTVSILIKPALAPAATPVTYNNPGILTESNGNWGIVYSADGVSVYHFSAGYKVATAAALGIGAWAQVDIRYDGTNVSARANNGAWQNTAAGPLGPITGATLRLGSNYANATFFTGDVMEAAVANTALSDGDLNKLRAYRNARYALSLP